MRKSRYTEEQIIRALKEADSGTPAGQIARRMGVTPTTFYRWRRKYGGMDVSEARRLHQLEEENRKLKHIVADQALELHVTKAILAKKW